MYHNNPHYRQRCPSLHYNVWGSVQGIQSTFVRLAINAPIDSIHKRLMLNINEMWMSLILQTLSTNNLTEWLPGQAEWAGRHLNVALPLWQSLSNDLIDRQEAIGSFASFTTSPDPTIREWAWNLRNSYNALRHSTDETIRKYYFHCIDKAVRAAGAKAELKKT